MAWVKRNLGLVIGGGVALALMVVAFFYLWSKIKEDQDITAQLDETTQKFQTLNSRPLKPGSENGKVNNIELAKDENKRLQAFLEEVRGKFGKRDLPTNISNRDFRALLDNTISDLQKKADSLGIKLPDKDYWFSFAAQRTSVEFKGIETLANQLMDVKELTEILYDAKVQNISGIRRVPASSDENNANDFLTDKKASTNDFAIVTPYELKFQGFSSELARVLERLVSASDCFVVTKVAVDRAPTEEVQATTPMMDMRRMNPYMSRYFPAAPQPTAPAQPKRPGNVLLDENKLLVLIELNAVRLKELPQSKAKREQPRVAQTNTPATEAAQ